ncbi:hypothetical protein B0H19DRAFT_1376810 [Mycena capillaripes]|nr:hypothetical protein B0H19DRAFT_1376810 [Mycena capillaripes]
MPRAIELSVCSQADESQAFTFQVSGWLQRTVTEMETRTDSEDLQTLRVSTPSNANTDVTEHGDASDVMGDESQASTSQFSGLGLKRKFTEREARTDAEHLDRLRMQTPSPTNTEHCHDWWDGGDVMIHFKDSGEVSKIRDFAFPPSDPHHYGGPPPPAHVENDLGYVELMRERVEMYIAAHPEHASAVRQSRAMSTSRAKLPSQPITPQNSQVINAATAATRPIAPQNIRIVNGAPNLITPPTTPPRPRVRKAPLAAVLPTPPVTPQSSVVMNATVIRPAPHHDSRTTKPLPRRTSTLSRTTSSWNVLE